MKQLKKNNSITQTSKFPVTNVFSYACIS